ncbi:peptidyl-alpha-hydroxyglycine alpha-amidating lyase family protein [Lacibacter sp.]|uniref:peptidyl-alpha-hydroxyglycine alpha-amidating lyase family protein n=1 Tax=Lacibacter sp. TaxID=1915409 RepID=UPI002B4B462D|nr:peptidyl-alpha-hydroxyglycine alpha-amidating lyase family protein [Lacibacter sp.]HLP39352.1 peptidyl-alpha-hydroxyglycine alpha-amidating lyase family protein [Lacibacter sp.]
MYTIKICFFLASVFLFACADDSNKNNTDQPINYALVEAWPQLPAGYSFGQPTGIGIDSKQHLFVFHRAGRKWTDPFPEEFIDKNTILELDAETGTIINEWGANLFIMPHGLTVDKQDNIWVTDVGLHQVLKFSHDGKLLMTLGVAKTPGNDSLHFNLPTDVAVADDGSFYVSDGYGNSRVVKFSASGNYLLEWGTKGSKEAEFNIPHGITIDKSEHVYVADRQNNRIQVFDKNGAFLRVLKNKDSVPQLPAVTIDSAQHLYAIDFDYTITTDIGNKGSKIFRYDSAGTIVFQFGSTGENKRTVSWYHDIAVDQQGNIYVGDIHGTRLLKFRNKGY